MQFTAVLMHAEEGGFIALNPETGTITQGEMINEALSNLQEPTARYLEEFPLVTSDHPWWPRSNSPFMPKFQNIFWI